MSITLSFRVALVALVDEQLVYGRDSSVKLEVVCEFGRGLVVLRVENLLLELRVDAKDDKHNDIYGCSMLSSLLW